MDLMDIRRGMMGQMAVEKMPRLVFHMSITLEETATDKSPKKIQLPIIQNGHICVLIDKYPAAPDPNIYITLLSSKNIFAKDNVQTGGSDILRPNGTIGSDTGASRYDTKTGVLSLGGGYGYYPAGTTYNIYAFEIADVDA